MKNSSKVIAFFDVDDTIIVGTNSLLLYVKYQVKKGTMSYWQVWRGLYLSFKHRLNLVNVEQVLDDFALPYKGVNDVEMKALSEDWFSTMVRGYIAREAIEKMAWHREQGHEVVLCSTSTQYVCEPLRRFLNMDGLIHTIAEVDDQGVLTGFLRKPLCHKEGKVFWAEKYAKAKDASLADCYFYSDSFSDEPLLSAVGKPVAVNPDPKLKKYAGEKGWAIEMWQTKMSDLDEARQNQTLSLVRASL